MSPYERPPVVTRPLTAAMERRVGKKVWIVTPNPLAVYTASLWTTSPEADEKVWRLEATGETEAQARDNLERLLAAVAGEAARAEVAEAERAIEKTIGNGALRRSTYGRRA